MNELYCYIKYLCLKTAVDTKSFGDGLISKLIRYCFILNKEKCSAEEYRFFGKSVHIPDFVWKKCKEDGYSEKQIIENCNELFTEWCFCEENVEYGGLYRTLISNRTGR